MQDSSTSQTVSVAPGAYGILSRGDTTRIDAYETASGLASYQSPKMGMVPGHTLCENHKSVTILSAFDKTSPFYGRGSLSTDVQMHCCNNRCFRDRLGCCVQWVCGFRGLDRPLAALVYQLPRVVHSAFGLEEVLSIDSGQASLGPDGQHSDSGLY